MWEAGLFAPNNLFACLFGTCFATRRSIVYTQSNPKSNLGIALVSVLFIAAAVLILALTFSRMIVSETQAVTASERINTSLQVADGVSERARAKVVNEYQESFLTVDNFIDELGKPGSALAFRASEENTTHAYSETIGSHTGQWKLTLPPTDANEKRLGDWLEITATAETPQGVQTVIRRVGLGTSNIFELAMLSKTTDCMYCHLRVRGDVGQLDFMRPGWGHETVHATEDREEQRSGVGSGGARGGSIVYGTAYAAGEVSDDANDPDGNFKRINGARFEGVESNYKGDKLPKNEDGKPDFPAIQTEVAIANANGSISDGARLWRGGDFDTFPTTNATIDSTNEGAEGNAILIGTKEKPIVLSDDVYFSGDVIIKGYVQGNGGIYAGRNIYVAGDIRYVDENADCWDKESVSDPNACAVADISAGKDELRLGARGNIVVGDYTEQKAGKDKTWDEQQASDFFKRQFGFEGNTTKYYQKGTGDELECSGSGSSQRCENADGKQIANVNVVAKQGEDAYDYSLRPGAVDSSGTFDGWLTDDQYQAILGKEKRSYNTWRKDVKRTDLEGEPGEADDLDQLREQFGHYQFGTEEAPDKISDESLRALLCRTGCNNGSAQRIDLVTENGKTVGLAQWDKDDDTLRVVIDTPQVYQKQVTRVDAFLYANQRIAGKTFMSPVVINGGLIAKEIGILAPGIRRSGFMPRNWSGPGNRDRYGFLDEIDCTEYDSSKQLVSRGMSVLSPDAVEDDAVQASGTHIPYDPDSDDCALTINYDYRLRNGGFGYNLVAANVGQTTGWKIADKRSQHVREPSR